jgi:hypothetical protein
VVEEFADLPDDGKAEQRILLVSSETKWRDEAAR